MSEKSKKQKIEQETTLPREHELIWAIIKMQNRGIRELALGMGMPEKHLKKFLEGISKISSDARGILFDTLEIDEEGFEKLYRSVERIILFNNNLSSEKKHQQLFATVMIMLPQLQKECKVRKTQTIA